MAYRKELDVPNKQDYVLRLINTFWWLRRKEYVIVCWEGKESRTNLSEN